MGKRRSSNFAFYDLNLEIDGAQTSQLRDTLSMALQLGFSGIAQNHVVTGTMAHADTCKIRPLDIPALKNSALDVARSARFHQEVLGVPVGQPFRQYSRLTVVVDNPFQASALNAGNPVLRSYDLVAVRPTNQKAFEQACTHLEVDIISLDLCHRLPFRLKPFTVKAAIERGVFFEIVYSQTFSDLKARTELFANAQMLQGLTRGRSVIVTSGARRLMDLRGPNDVANMATLFGLSREAAQAAVSTNCKAVILHGLARKKTYKGSIAIENCPFDGVLGSHEAWFAVPKVWDPLSNSIACDFIPMTQKLGVASNLPDEKDNNQRGDEDGSEEQVLHHKGVNEKELFQYENLVIENARSRKVKNARKQGKRKADALTTWKEPQKSTHRKRKKVL